MQLMRHAEDSLIATAIFSWKLNRDVGIGANFLEDAPTRNTEWVD